MVAIRSAEMVRSYLRGRTDTRIIWRDDNEAGSLPIELIQKLRLVTDPGTTSGIKPGVNAALSSKTYSQTIATELRVPLKIKPRRASNTAAFPHSGMGRVATHFG
jgi:hypothetical protein